MVVGLINSDGCCDVKDGKIKRIIFCNTVKSVVDVFTGYLKSFNISYKINEFEGRVDARNGHKCKNKWVVRLNLDSVDNLLKLSNIQLKGECRNA